MKNSLPLILLFLVVLTSCDSKKDEKQQVRDAFEHYKSSIQNHDGEAAYEYVSERTIQYYDDISKKIKNADSSTVANLSLMDKMTVLSIRFLATKDEILSFDGKKLFVYSIDHELTGGDNIMSNTVGKVILKDDFAQGEFMVDGKKSSLYLDFYKENGEWKLDLTSLFHVISDLLTKMIDESGQTEDDFLFIVLQTLTGEMPDNDVWHPVK